MSTNIGIYSFDFFRNNILKNPYAKKVIHECAYEIFKVYKRNKEKFHDNKISINQIKNLFNFMYNSKFKGDVEYKIRYFFYGDKKREKKGNIERNGEYWGIDIGSGVSFGQYLMNELLNIHNLLGEHLLKGNIKEYMDKDIKQDFEELCNSIIVEEYKDSEIKYTEMYRKYCVFKLLGDIVKIFEIDNKFEEELINDKIFEWRVADEE